MIIIISFYLPKVFMIPQVSDIGKKYVLGNGHPSQYTE